MRRAIVVLLIVGCGRIGFDPTGGIDITGDGPLPVGRWRSVSVGESATCGVTVTDELWCWGNGGYGVLGTGTDAMTQPPTKIPGAWHEVRIGTYHTCGVKTDSSLWCWGLNDKGQLGAGPTGVVVKTPLQVEPAGWATVTVGEEFTCGIKTTGVLACWGGNEFGQVGDNSSLDRSTPTVVDQAQWMAVSAGRLHACGIRVDGSLWCWGRGKEGELGNDILDIKYFPQAIAVGRTWKAVRASDVHTCAIEAATNDVWCWGENYTTMLGDGTYMASPVPKKTTQKGTAVALANATTCVLHDDGTAHCVGSTGRAEFGLGAGDDVRVPTAIALTRLVAVEAGGQTTCAIDDEKHLFCAGANSYGQTGQPYGEVHDATTPTDARRDWVGLAAARRHACARTATGETWCWGDGYAGQNGDGRNFDRQTPQSVGVTGFTSIQMGEETTLGLKADGTLWAWGAQISGNALLSPEQVATNTTGFAVGDRHGCRLSTQALRCGGFNERGQLGTGNNNATTSEVTIGGTWNGVWANLETTCATDTTNTLFCWGRGDSGQLGNGGTVDANTPTTTGLANVRYVGIGAGFACALRGDNTIYCWGDADAGQFGNGAPEVSTTPVRSGTRSDWTKLAVGDRHVCAIAGGALYCWGHGDEGQLGDPMLAQRNAPFQVGTDTTWTDVVAGDHFTCALKADGARYCFGANEDGQLGNDRTWQKTFLAVP